MACFRADKGRPFRPRRAPRTLPTAMLRALCFAMLVASPLVCAGCILDAGAYSNAGGSTTSSPVAGSGGSDTTSSSTTGGSGGTTTTSSTTSTATCTTSCDDANPCTDDACTDGACTHAPRAMNTPVADTDMTDCKQDVCDGAGNIVTVADDTEVPPGAAGQCYAWKCSNQMPMIAPANQGQSCSAVYDVTCQSPPTCQGTTCTATNLPDFSVQLGMCGTASCQSGMYSVSLDDGACSDPGGNGCTVAKCNDQNGTPACGTDFAPQGKGCLKFGQYSGSCNGQGHCCNQYGCD